MTWIDWIVLFGFLGYTVWDGVRRTSGASNLEGYYAGNRRIPWWAAGLSVMATQASAITIIGTTGQGHDQGMHFLHVYLGMPLALVLLCIFFVPMYRRQPLLTAYEFLERRFGPATRTLASLIFLCSRCLAVGIVIFAPAVVLSSMIQLDLTVCVLLIGLLTTGYTMFGGVAAVIWTDVKQMTVIVVGLVAAFVIVLARVLGDMSLDDALQVAGAAGKMNALDLTPEFESLMPRWKGDAGGERSFWEGEYNLWSGLFGGLFLMLSYFGCDQTQVQRLLTSSSPHESQKALLLSAFAKIPMQFLVLLLGVLLYVFHLLHAGPLLFDRGEAERAASIPAMAQIEDRYAQAFERRKAAALEIAALPHEIRPSSEAVAAYRVAVDEIEAVRREAGALVGRWKEGEKPRNDTNYVFPQFLLEYMPPVLLGLIIAAIFAAAMSSIDSALNALSAATVVDFYRRFVRPNGGDREQLIAARSATAFWGLLSTGAALWLGGGTSLIEQVNKVGSYFYGALLGVFTLALVCRRAGARAGVASLVGGMATVVAIETTFHVHFLWHNLFGLVGALVAGFLVSRAESETKVPGTFVSLPRAK